MTGFEPVISSSQTTRVGQTTLHPVLAITVVVFARTVRIELTHGDLESPSPALEHSLLFCGRYRIRTYERLPVTA